MEGGSEIGAAAVDLSDCVEGQVWPAELPRLKFTMCQIGDRAIAVSENWSSPISGLVAVEKLLTSPISHLQSWCFFIFRWVFYFNFLLSSIVVFEGVHAAPHQLIFFGLCFTCGPHMGLCLATT